MTALCNGIKLDSDQSAVQGEYRCQSIQSFYVSTGCDSVSFTRLGMASFLSAQYAKFIASGDPIGSIQTQIDEPDASFLSFVHLVGCKAHSSAFKLETPVAQFYSVGIIMHNGYWLYARKSGYEQTMTVRLYPLLKRIGHRNVAYVHRE